jgi:hypothetical protein
MKNKEKCTGEDHKMGYSQHCGFTRNSGYTYVKRQQRKCTYKCNIEECLRNDCCCGKASTAYFEGVSLASVIQRAEHMHCIILSSVARLAVPWFFFPFFLPHTISYMPSGIPRKFVWGYVQQIQLRTERMGICGVVAPSQGFWR